MLKLWGIPYRWGGSNPMGGFDCSGGVLEILKSIGLWPSGSDVAAVDLYNFFSKPENGAVLTSDPTAGTLVFFGLTTKTISHVGMLYDETIMFEYGSGDSTTTNLLRAMQQNAFGRFRPYTHRRDLVALVRPNVLHP